MDRRVLFASLILFAGGAAGVGVAVFAFVGLDDATADTAIVWESDPAAGDDGTGAVVATVDGDPHLLQPISTDGSRAVRALDADGNVAWTAAVPGDANDTSGLAAGDLSGGDASEDPVVAFTTDEGDLVVLDAHDGTERFVVALGGVGGLPPAIGDLNGDGEREIVAADADGGVVAVGADGEPRFETRLEGTVAIEGGAALEPLIVGSGDPGVGDADSDADSDVDPRGIAVVTRDVDGQTVHLLDQGGEPIWSDQLSATALSWNVAESRRGSILALGNSDGTLTTLEAADGSLRYEVGLQDVPIDVGEADAGRIHVGGTGDVWAVDLLDGEVVWKQQYGGEVRVNAPAVGDVNGDGTDDVLAVNRGGEVLGMNRNGEAIARGGSGDVVVYAGSLLADLTDDGSVELIVIAEDGVVIAQSG